MAELSREEILRYSRHLVLPEVGRAGQERLKDARVLCVGAGGLGSPLALYLAAAGIGTLGVVDFDAVDASNLQRQILHGTKDVGRSKVVSAAETLRDLNPHTSVVLHEERLSAANALGILEGYDVIADGTDNFPARYLVNDACVLLGRPDVYGSIYRFEGQASVFSGRGGPCYRCLYPEPPPPGVVPSCAEGGVLGILPGVIGAIQATEVVKLVLGVGETLVGRLLLYDALALTFREMRVRRDPECPVCGENPTIRELRDTEEVCGAEGAAPASAAFPDHDIAPRELAARLDRGEPLFLLDVRNPEEFTLCRLNGAELLPVHELPERWERLDPERDTVVYCHTGVRSALAAAFLRARGFGRVRNLLGGIEAWSLEVDPAMPRY